MRFTSILAIFGECSGKMRSTPSPCTMRRTVNISRMPSPRAGDDHAAEDLDALLLAFQDALVDVHRVADLELGHVFFEAGLLHQGHQSILHGRLLPSCRCRRRWFVGSRRLRASRLFAPPAGDGLVIAAQQDLRHRHAAEHARPGVLRILQPARLAVRFLRHALRRRPARRARSGSPCRSPPSPALRRRCRRSRRSKSRAASGPGGCARRSPRSGRTAAAAACASASSCTTACVSRSPAGRQHDQLARLGGLRPARPRRSRRPARA